MQVIETSQCNVTFLLVLVFGKKCHNTVNIPTIFLIFIQSINLFHDAKAQGEAVKDQMVTLVHRTQMQQLTIHEQKGGKKEQNKIIIT